MLMTPARPSSLSSWTSCHGLLSRGSSTGCGDHRVRTLSCAEIPTIAFAQLTIGKACAFRDLPRGPRSRNSITWASASRSGARRWPMPRKARNWRIHAAFKRLVTQARTHVDEELGWTDQYRLRPGLDDHRSVPVGLSVGALRTTKACRCQRCSTCGAFPSFIRNISDGKLARRSSSICSPEAGAIYVVAQSWLPLCPPLCVAPSLRPSSSRVPSTHRCSSRLFGADGSLDRHHLRPDHLPTASYIVRITPNFCGASASRTPSAGKTLVFITSNFSLPAATICALYKTAGRWNSSSSGSPSSIFGPRVLRHASERAMPVESW